MRAEEPSGHANETRSRTTEGVRVWAGMRPPRCQSCADTEAQSARRPARAGRGRVVKAADSTVSAEWGADSVENDGAARLSARSRRSASTDFPHTRNKVDSHDSGCRSPASVSALRRQPRRRPARAASRGRPARRRAPLRDAVGEALVDAAAELGVLGEPLVVWSTRNSGMTSSRVPRPQNTGGRLGERGIARQLAGRGIAAEVHHEREPLGSSRIAWIATEAPCEKPRSPTSTLGARRSSHSMRRDAASVTCTGIPALESLDRIPGVPGRGHGGASGARTAATTNSDGRTARGRTGRARRRRTRGAARAAGGRRGSAASADQSTAAASRAGIRGTPPSSPVA